MKVELSLHAAGLKDVNFGPKVKCDPYAVVTKISTSTSDKPQVLGKTEVIENTRSPEWIKVFILDYELGQPLKLVVSIYHESKSMGSCVLDVGEILGARGQTKAKRIKQGGSLVAHCRPSVGTGLFRFQLQATDLKNTEGFMRKSDPFLELARQINSAGGSTWDNVYRSKVIKDSLDPVWESDVMALSTLCGGNQDLPIRVSVFDFESSGKHVLMGRVETSVKGLVDAAGGSTCGKMPLTLKGEATGQLLVTRAVVSGAAVAATAAKTEEKAAPVEEQMAKVTVKDEPEVALAPAKPSFLDYIAGGCELNVVVGIDFTGSNGDPRQPGTLHHFDRNSMNPYEKAIEAIVSILAKYDSDQKFPVLGFGAKYDGVARHAFQVGPEEESHGVEGVLKSYESVFKTGLILSGPTVFTEVMQVAAARAKSSLEAAQSKGGMAYTVLLIISDGAVSDVSATAECLKQISDSPLSVVIVGVGEADFSAMQFLDDIPDVKRDMAQFVAMNKYPHKNDLTSATLKEIPDQLTGYFESHGIAPKPPLTRSESSMSVAEADEEEIDLSLDFKDEEIVISGGGFDTSSW